VSNEAVYASGLLNRALDPANQPAAILEFLREEGERLQHLVGNGRRLVDFGCGTGRHLTALAPQLSFGLGLDYQRAYIEAAIAVNTAASVHFIVADATNVPCSNGFDLAICTTNTWGTMPDKLGVLSEMRRVAPHEGSRIVSVFGPTSVEPRREWYGRLGNEVVTETDEYLETADGFRSEHFTLGRLRTLVGSCDTESIADIGYLVFA
jgi:SAM-dependent methyltransferase